MLLQIILVFIALFAHSSLAEITRDCRTSGSACLNGGTCVDVKNGSICACPPGFSGRDCSSPIRIPKKICPKLQPLQNGRIIIIKRFGRKIARFKCNKGSKLIGSFVSICRQDGTWNRARTVCKKKIQKKCDEPPTIRHGSSDRTTRKSVTYRCRIGYRLRGPSQKTCKEGKWIPTRSTYCRRERRCKNPGIPRNGKRFGSTFAVDTHVRFDCNVGFDLIGDKNLVCKPGGLWNKRTPTCQKKDPLRDLKRSANGLRKHFINKLELLTSDSRARSGLSSGAAGLDLVFVFDSSASVGITNFRKGVEFARTIIQEFGISSSPTGTRVAVVVFSTNAQVIFNLQSNRIVDENSAIATLGNLALKGGGTATSLGLQSVIDNIVPEVRNNSKKALFLITDGKYNTGGNPSKPSQVLRDGFHFEIFAIGISDNVYEKELRDIASEPFRTHVYLMKDFQSLAKLNELITIQGTNYSECGVAGDTQLRDDPGQRFRVVGGKESKAGAWPWLAAIYIKDNFRCGGALIADNWILTVAHCFYFDGKVKGSDVVVRLGEHDRTFEEGSEQNVRVKRIIKHKRASKTRLDYDLALLKLRTPAKLTSYVRTVCLPMQKDRTIVRPNNRGVIAGWGSTQKTSDGGQGGPTSPIIKQVRLPFVSRHLCNRNISNPVTERMMCAGDGTGTMDACKGDSGSPLVFHRPGRDWAVAGLSSWGEGCAQKGKYGVYSNLLNQEYIDWIAKKSKVTPIK